MPIEKIELGAPESHSADLIADNLAKLKALFPELLTEGPQGAAINVDVLKSLVGDATVTDADEKYGLNWHGKRAARQLALTPSTGTLRPCPEESVDWDTTQNLMIEGDNLEVLKLLQKSYAGKVKLIYIDPPYNTGKDFVYPDNFQDNVKNYLELTGQVEGGKKVSSNTEASGRFHTDWLNMIYPRLTLARNLLSQDGVLFCSIDDIEASKLKQLLDEVFGEENFLSQFSWRTDGNFDNQAKIKKCHEYVLLYAKNVEEFPHPPVVDPSTPADSKLFRPEIRNTIIKNGPKNPISRITLPLGFPADFSEGIIPIRSEPWPKYIKEAAVKNGKLIASVEVESGWSSKDLVLQFIENGCVPIRDAKGQETSFLISRTGAIEVVKKRSDCQSHVISVLNGFGGTQKASAQLEEIGAFFNGYPKPQELLQYFVQMSSCKNGLYMDFFAGSGTLGHAVMAQNIQDAGKRRFLLVQLQEPLIFEDESQQEAALYCDTLGVPRTISELTKHRLRRAAQSLLSEKKSNQDDLGFRVFKLDSSNIRAWSPSRNDLAKSLLDNIDHVDAGRSDDDVLYELLLKLGLDLCVPVEQKAIAGKTVSSVGGGVLLACLDKQITAADAEPLALGIVAWHKALGTAGDVTCVFRDSAFVNDVAKTNLAAILEQYGIAKVRSL